MRKIAHIIGVLILALFMVSPANAALVAVSGPPSSSGTAPAIIAAPPHALDDIVFNTGMQGFDEAQGVVTTVDHYIDGGLYIPAGTLVDSHMIFLNSEGTSGLSHYGVDWTFSGAILGIMSDYGGELEAASTFELGNPSTNYTATFAGSGPAAPFPARGLESGGSDGYSLIDAYTLRVSMGVSEPGDWIRVITASSVPEPSTLLLLGSGLVGLVGFRRNFK